jgi:hypothetical protein
MLESDNSSCSSSLSLVVKVTTEDSVRYQVRLDVLQLACSFLKSCLDELAWGLNPAASPDLLAVFPSLKPFNLLVVIR